MNFRQRLINVLFVACCVIPAVITIWNVIYGLGIGRPQLTLVEVFIFACVPTPIVAGFSFLIGTGFKVWHK